MGVKNLMKRVTNMNNSARATIRNYLSEWARLVRTDRSAVMYAAVDWQFVNDDNALQIDDPIMIKVYNCLNLVRQVWPNVFAMAWHVYVLRESSKDAGACLGYSKRTGQALLRQLEDYLFFFLYGAATTELDESPDRYQMPKPILQPVFDWPHLNRKTLSLQK